MEFRVLGPFELCVAGRPVDVGPARLRSVAAALLADAGRIVAVDTLIDRVWDGVPPTEVRHNVHTYVSRIRRLLAGAALTGRQPPALVRRAGGYVLEVDPDQVDLHRFRGIVADARTADDPRHVAAGCREALALWRGAFCADLTGGWFDLVREELDAERGAALVRRFDAELALGRHADVLPELTAVSAAQPLDERLAGQVMLAAYRCGRRPEALDRYERARRGLADELGVDPSPDLRRLHDRILHADPTLIAPAGTGGQSVPASPSRKPAPTTPAPAQLPHDVTGFTGRDRELADLDRLLPEPDAASAGNALTIAVVAGTAGVGKTTLAVHWAHQIRHRFPDGQLYANLRGYAPAPPMRPIEVLVGFLRAMGVPADRVPADEQQATALYRSVLAGRRVLVVLDNARGAEQIRPLLPGAPGCLVLATSRDRLDGLLVRDGAQRVALDVFTPEESVSLLARLVGPDRVDAEPAVAAELATACAHLPLALRIAAAALTDDPRRTIAGYVTALGADNRLDALAVEGDEETAVRATFDLSYATLAPPAQRLFRLLSLVPGPDFTVATAAALTGTTVAAARPLLDRLVAAHLVGQHSPGRYAFHDLLRAYAAERAGADDPDADRAAATTALHDWYLRTTAAAARLLYPGRPRLPLPTALPRPPPGFDAPDGALAWLDAERPNLVAAIVHGAHHGPRPTVLLLTDALSSYFWLRMQLADWLVASRAGLAAAEADGDLQGQAAARLSLADAHTRRSEHAQAVTHYERALALARQADWPAGQSAALGNLGIVDMHWGRLDEAADRFTASLAVNRRIGRLTGQATNLGNLGLVYLARGQLEEAADHFTQAVTLSRTSGTRSGIAVNLTNLGEACYAMGRFDQALDHLEEALARHRAAGNRGSEAETLRAVAQIHHDAGRHVQAYEAAHAALALIRSGGERYLEADALNAVAAIDLALGRPADAIDQHRQALRVARDTRNRQPEVTALVGLAAALQHARQLDHAHDCAAKARELARQAGYRILEARAGVALAHLHRARNEPDEAIRHARQALALDGATGHRLGLARTHLLLGHLLHDTCATDEGEGHLRQARDLFADLGVPETDDVRSLPGESARHGEAEAGRRR